MFLIVFVQLFISVCGRDLFEPRFQVLTPNELMVEVPRYDDMTFVTFRMGLRRKDNEVEDLELGENSMNNNRIFIYDERLNLNRGDVVNYLLAFKDTTGYHAQTGKYTFDGAYYKKPFGRRHRLRRHAITSSTTEKSEYNIEDAEEFNPVDSRFGGGHHHHRGRFPGHNPNNFNPFPPPQFGPPTYGPVFPKFPKYPHPGQTPNFGVDCSDHRHDNCHHLDSERWERTTNSPALDYHCRICHKGEKSTTTTTTEFPDIDIRFSNDS